MKIQDINTGDKVVHIPEYLLIGNKSKMIKEENLGIVTSKNDTYVFVQYNGKNNSEATDPKDLYNLKNRPDLVELINS